MVHCNAFQKLVRFSPIKRWLFAAVVAGSTAGLVTGLTMSAVAQDSTAATLSERESKVSEFVLCRSGKIVRTLRVIEVEDGFEAYYNKLGVDKKVGGGKGIQSCKDVVKNIRNNLEAGGWRCRDLEGVKYTELIEKVQ